MAVSDWHKLYNRADSAIRHRDPAIAAASLVDGSTRHRAFELLATDVKRSLDMGASASQQVKNAAVRTASLGWTPDLPVVRELASQGITLAKSTWPGAEQLPHEGTTDGRFGFAWKCSIRDAGDGVAGLGGL